MGKTKYQTLYAFLFACKKCEGALIKPIPNLALRNNLSLKPGKVRAVGYGRGTPSIPCTYKSLLQRFSRRSSKLAFTHVHCLYLPSNDMLISFQSKALPLIYLTISFGYWSSSHVIAKTKSNESQGLEATLLKALHSCLISTYRWEYWCLRFPTTVFNPCDVLCKLSP